jgi:hypothetical protein
MRKGQLYLNGRNVGRFWAVDGTQKSYYLPRPWMRGQNRLVCFEELGLRPDGARLEWGAGPEWVEEIMRIGE